MEGRGECVTVVWVGVGNVLVEVDATVGKFAEGPLLLELCGGRSGLVLIFAMRVVYRCRLTAMSLFIEIWKLTSSLLGIL